MRVRAQAHMHSGTCVSMMAQLKCAAVLDHDLWLVFALRYKAWSSVWQLLHYSSCYTMYTVLKLSKHAWAESTICLNVVAAVLLAEEFTTFTARTRQACSTPTSPVSVTQAWPVGRTPAALQGLFTWHELC